jgi:hypothetical protein
LHYVKAHHISRAALIMGAVFAALLFFAVGGVLRLLVGPISLGPFGGTLSQAIHSALPGITLKYDQAAVEWSRDEGRVNLVVLGARIFDADGRIIAQAPKADIDLAAEPFLHGKIAVRRITLVGVQLTLVHMKDGGLRLGVEKDRSQQNILTRLNDVLKAHTSSQSTLESLAVRNARIAIYDERTGIFLVAPRANLQVSAKDDAIATHFDADIEISGKPAHLKADLTLPPGDGPTTGTASVTGLDLRALGNNAAMFAPLKKIGLLVDMHAAFTITPGSHLAKADFHLDAHGALAIPHLTHGPLTVRDLKLAGHYDGVKNHIALFGSSLDADGIHAQLRGQGDFSYSADDTLKDVAFGLGLTKIAVNLPGVFAGPFTLQSADLSAHYAPATHALAIDRFTVLGPSLNFQTAGTVSWAAPGAPAIAVKGTMAALPVHDLLRYWPLHVGEGPRAWIDRNIFSGMAGPFVFDTNLAAGVLDGPQLPDDAVRLSFAMANVEGAYIKGMTHASQLQGSALLTGDNFSVKISSGRIGALVLSQGAATIPNLHLHGTKAAIGVHIAGALPDIMTLIDMKPLGYPTRFGIDPAQTGGQASVDLALTVPMLRDLPVAAIGISVKAAVSDFAVTLGTHTRVTDGTVNFVIDNNRLHQTGTVYLADSKLAVDWTEDFTTKNPITTHLLVKGIVKDGARDALHLGLDDYLAGPADVTATITGHRGSLTKADMMLDLTRATLMAKVVGLSKPAGKAAHAHVVANFAPGDLVQNETVRITGPDIAANGTILFDKTGTLTHLQFPIIKMGALNDLSFGLTRSATGMDYEVRGRSLDGSKIGHEEAVARQAAIAQKVGEASREPFHLSVKLDRLALKDGVSIAPFALEAGGIGNRLGALALSGNLSPTATVTGSFDAADGDRHLDFATSGAGLLAKGLLGFTSMKGGKLTLTVTLPGAVDGGDAAPGTPDYKGRLVVRDFMMVNQPFLSRLFAAGSLTGFIGLMQGEGISFDKMEVPFSARNGVISVHDARAAGPAIGATADGYIDRPKNDVALKGSLVPAYGLNSVLGNIPLLGDLLVSKKGEGIFGVTYSVHGNADEPSISVNPLAVLTPGILRRIFEGHIPNASNAPSNNPGNAPSPKAAPVTPAPVTPAPAPPPPIQHTSPKAPPPAP